MTVLDQRAHRIAADGAERGMSHGHLAGVTEQEVQ